MKMYVLVMNGAELIPTTLTAESHEEAMLKVSARFPGCKIGLITPATPWDAPADMLAMARDLDPPKAAKAA